MNKIKSKIIVLILVNGFFILSSLAGALSVPTPTLPTTPLAKPNKILVGRASWYGYPFHGRMTANGETYNMYDLTAAHKTLPFGSLLKVTNLSNNKQIFVRVNDRGPYVGDRILDLSFTAAKRLGLVQTGVAKVHVEVYSPKDAKNLVYALEQGYFPSPY